MQKSTVFEKKYIECIFFVIYFIFQRNNKHDNKIIVWGLETRRTPARVAIRVGLYLYCLFQYQSFTFHSVLATVYRKHILKHFRNAPLTKMNVICEYSLFSVNIHGAFPKCFSIHVEKSYLNHSSCSSSRHCTIFDPHRSKNAPDNSTQSNYVKL